MNVRKRSGKVVSFDAEFIRRAVTLAAAAAGEHDPDGVDRVTEAVQARLEATGQETVDIERIQDTVEEALFEQQFYRTAKAYILYRMQKEKERAGGGWKEGILTREFLSPYKHMPNPMEQLGAFVYTRTYSRYLPQQGRREFCGRPCAGRWNTTPRWLPLPGKRRRNFMTTFTICGSSCPDAPCG